MITARTVALAAVGGALIGAALGIAYSAAPDVALIGFGFAAGAVVGLIFALFARARGRAGAPRRP